MSAGAPAPQVVAITLWQKADILFANLIPTAIEALSGFLIGNLVAIGIATLFVHRKTVEMAFFPIVVLINSIPVVAKAPILVLDDALASVDNRTAAAILQSLTLDQQRTVLFISHQLSAAAACDRVLVLENGRLVQQGKHRQLLDQEGAYRRLWDREQATSKLETA